MLYFISGPDRHRAIRFLEEECARFLGQRPGSTIVDIRYEGSEEGEILAALHPLVSNRELFLGERIIALRECLSSVSRSDAPVFKKLLKTRAGPKEPPLFLFENDPAAFDDLKKDIPEAVFHPFPFLSRRDLATWGQKEAERLGGKIDRRVAELLAKHLGPETARLARELARLVAFKGGRPVVAKDISIVGQAAGERSAFTVIRALERRDLGQALRELSLLRSRSSDLSHLLGILSWQLRSLVAGRGQARFTTVALQNLLRFLHEVDFSWKSGREDPLVALERYFIEFAKRAY